MSISFSGLASGLDTSSWVESLVRLKQAKVTTLEEKKDNVLLSQETLNGIKSFFSSFRSVIEKVTDAKFGVASMDLFAQNLATSSNLNVLTGSVTTEAEEATYDITVSQLASNTSAISNYSYTTTIVETTIASLDSKLVNLGVNIHETGSNIGVQYNGIEHGITLEQNDTIQDFIDKLQKIGVNASYNEQTGIFSMNINDGDINDIDNTNIVNALHLKGVNEGYSSNNLQVEHTDTVYSAATTSTLLSDLGVKTGLVTIHANDADYTITINDNSTLGSFLNDLKANNIDAELDATGVFTLTGADITNEGTTDILNALGLSVDIYSKTQKTGDLSIQTVVTQTTTATTATLLKDIGEGITITNGQTVVVKNSNNEYKTIQVGTTTTIGDLLSEINKAGLSATINSDGIVSISGGVISGGTFDALSALGLTESPYSALVTGNMLTHTVETKNVVTSSTKLVEDLGSSEGYVELTDASGNKHYEKIKSGMTMGEFISDLQSFGINASLDDNGVLSVVGGGLKTLTTSEVQSLISNGTISETNSAYIKGSDILTQLFGTPSVSADSVGSATSKTEALTYSVTQTVKADSTTTLGELGLNDYFAFTLDGQKYEANGNTTLGELAALNPDKITFNEETGKLIITGVLADGGSGNLEKLTSTLALETTTTGKYALSSSLYSKETVVATATTDTLLSEFGISNSLNSSNRTVYLYDADGNQLSTTTVVETTKLGELVNWINSSGGHATLSDGVLKITEGYIQNATLESGMGLQYTSSSSYVLGSVMTTTTVVGATGDSKLSDIISNLGTTSSVSGGYNLSFNSKSLSVSGDTTLNDLIALINQNGGTAGLDSTGRLNINGGTLTGSVAAALGFTSVTNISSVSASGKLLQTTQEVYADNDTLLKDIGVSSGTFIVNNKYGTALKTITVDSTSSIGAMLNTLSNEGINGAISNGVISLTSVDGNYVTGSLATALGITSSSTTEVINTTQSSTLAVNYTDTITANASSTLGDVGAITNSSDQLIVYDSEANAIGTITGLTTSSTLGQMFNELQNYSIQASITDGTISLYSPDGNYIGGNIATNLGIARKDAGSTTYTIGQSVSSTSAVSYTLAFDVTGSTKISDSVSMGSSAVVAIKDSTNTSTVGNITIYNTTTFDTLFSQLADYGISAVIQDNRINVTSTSGNVMVDSSGTVLSQLGINLNDNSYTTIKGLSTTSTVPLTYTVGGTAYADESTKLKDVGVTDGTFVLYNSSGSAICTYSMGADATIGDLFTTLSNNGVDAVISSGNGVITIRASSEKYIKGALADALGIGTTSTTTTTTVTKTMTSSAAIMIVTSGVATTSSTLSDLGLLASHVGVINSSGATIGVFSTSATTTLGDIISELANYDITATLSSSGVLSLSSSPGNAITGNLCDQMGITATKVTSGTVTTTVGKSSSSSSTVTYTIAGEAATRDTTLSEVVGGYDAWQTLVSNNATSIVVRESDGTLVGADRWVGNDTLGAVFDYLSSEYGVTATINNGVISITSSSGRYITGGIADALGIGTSTVTSSSTTGKTFTSSTSILVTTTSTTTQTVGISMISTVALTYTGSGTTTTGLSCTSPRSTLWDSGYVTTPVSTVSGNCVITRNVSQGSSSYYVKASELWNCSFSELGLSGNGTVVLESTSGQSYTKVVSSTDTVSTLRDSLYSYNMTMTVESTTHNYATACQVSLTQGNNWYIKEISSNLSSIFGIYAGAGTDYTYEEEEVNYYYTVQEDDTIGEVAFGEKDWDQYNDTEFATKINVHGEIYDFVVTGNSTVGETVLWLNQLCDGNYASFSNGVFTFNATDDCYIIGDVEDNGLGYIFGMSLGEGYSYSVSGGSGTQTAAVETTLAELGVNSDCYLTVSDQDGNLSYVTVNGSNTMYDLCGQLNAASSGNAAAQITPTGKFYFEGNGNAFIVAGSQALLDALHISIGEGKSYSIQSSSTTSTALAASTTKLSELGLTGTYYVTILNSGTSKVVTVTGSNTISELVSKVNAVKPSGSNMVFNESNGQIGFVNMAVTGMSSELANALHLTIGNGSSYSVTTSTTVTNSNSDALGSTSEVLTMTSDTTLSQLGISGTQYVTLVVNGTTKTVTMSSSSTVGTLVNSINSAATTALAGVDSSGKFYTSGFDSVYIKGWSSSLASALKFSAGSGSTYTTSVSNLTGYVNSSSKALVDSTGGSTTLRSTSTYADLELTDSYYGVTVVQNGTTTTVKWNSGESLQTFFNTLSGYGITGSISNGKVTLSGSSSSYIKGIEYALASALKLTAGSGYSYTTSQSTVTSNTTSSALVVDTTETVAADSNTTMSQLGITSTQYITVMNDGTRCTVTVNASDTVNDISYKLQNYGINFNIYWSDGTLELGRNGYTSYIEGMSSALKTALKCNTGEGYTYKSTYVSDYSNSNSASLGQVNSVLQMTTSTTFGELGFSGTNYINGSSNGTDFSIAVSAGKSLSDIMTALASKGISSEITDGKLTLTPNANCYITGISSSALQNILKLPNLGSGNSYTTQVVNTYTNTSSNSLKFTRSNLVLDGTTRLDKINGISNGTGKLSVHKADGSFVTFTVSSTSTLNDFFSQISAYGLTGSVSSDGKVSIVGTGDVYLQSVSGGTNLLTALKIGSAQQNTQTTHSNRTSSLLKETLTVAATGTTTLEKLLQADSQAKCSFDSSGNVSLTLTTKSNAGDKNVTLSFSKTQTLTDVIDRLSTYGINAKVDSTGKFSVSGNMTDFTIGGTLGSYLMGSYSKEYQSDTTYNTSTVLTQKSVNILDDSTALSNFGITGGDIVVMSDGKVSSTISIDTSSIVTVGDFKNELSRYGFSANIDSSGRLSVTSLEGDYLASVSGGSNILKKLGIEGASVSGVTQQSSVLSQTTVSNKTVSMNSKLSDLTDSSGNSLGITSGNVYVYKDGVRNTIYIDSDITVNDLASKLSKFNVNVGISDGKLYFEGIGDSYITTDGLTSASMTNLLSKAGVSSDGWSSTMTSESGELTHTQSVDKVINRAVKLSELQDASGKNLGITSGTYNVYVNGVKYTESVDADTTVDDLLSALEMHGFKATIGSNGAITLSASGNSYLEAGSSNLVSKLFSDWQFVNTYTSDKLETVEYVTQAIDRTTKLSEINEGSYQDGYITVVKDGVQKNLYLSGDTTVGGLMDELALYGFESVLNDRGQLIVKGEGNSTLKNYTGSSQASNALDLLGIEDSNWVVMNTYGGTSLDVVTKTNDIVGAGRDTLLSELGVTTGEYYIYNNGVKNTALISSDETLGSFIDTLEKFGLQVSITGDGDSARLTILGSGDSYISKSASATNSSNVVEVLFGLNAPESKYSYSAQEETSTIVTTFTSATEDTLLSYYDKPWGGTTLKSEGDLSVTVNGVTSVIQIGADETFGTLIEKFRALGLEATLSDGQLMIQSGYDSFTINPGGTTSSLLSTIGLAYQSDLGGYVASVDTVMATTTTVEERTLSVSNYADLSTKLGLLNISDGSLSVYCDGQKATIQIDSNETLGDLRSRLASAFSDLELSFEDGYLKIYSSAGKHVEVGATTDTTNFSSITGITTNEDGEALSARALYCVNGDSVITGSGLFRRGDVTEGSFYIGDAMFTVDSTTTLNNLISQINSSDEANATAYWDTIDGKLVIQSRTTGSAYINIEAGTSNFTDIMGYTSSEWASDGSLSLTRMEINSQEIGKNARFTINGTSFTSNSNTITSDISKIKGLTINLKGLTDGSAVTLTVERDKETLANAMSEVVDSYNELMANVDAAIATDGQLHSETTLKMIRNQLRSLMTSSDIGTTVFRNLDAIGISVDKASANNISTSTQSIINLTFDKDKFLDAYEADSDALKALLIGSETNTGIFIKVETLLESALQGVSGYFDVTDSSYTKEANKIESKITKANAEIERYRARLEAKFQSMDMIIANLQQQYSSFLVT